MPPCRFASAAPEEEYVYGACAPGWDRSAGETTEEWTAFMRDNGVERVCCLLSEQQLAEYDDLLGEYEASFGPDRVEHVPVPDHTLVSEEKLSEEIVPFLGSAVGASERVVVHCKAGIGRTGLALAGWLVYAYDYVPVEAITTVANRHRSPDDAVRAGNATREELLGLLNALR
jgi:protein-tyrosine phosphatase